MKGYTPTSDVEMTKLTRPELKDLAASNGSAKAKALAKRANAELQRRQSNKLAKRAALAKS